MFTLLSRKLRGTFQIITTKTLVAKTERASQINRNFADRSWTPWPRAHSPPQLSWRHRSFEKLWNPLLIARNTFTPLIDARKTEHSIFQRESGHVEIEMNDDARVLKVERACEGGRKSEGYGEWRSCHVNWGITGKWNCRERLI